METKKFGEVPIGAYFEYEDKYFKKRSFNTALHMYGREILQFQLYDEVLVAKNPTFVLNY